MNIIFTGIQGSGKGTHAKKLSTLLKLSHISFGDVIKKYLIEEKSIDKKQVILEKEIKKTSSNIDLNLKEIKK